jgi:hypothetical protein
VIIFAELRLIITRRARCHTFFQNIERPLLICALCMGAVLVEEPRLDQKPHLETPVPTEHGSGDNG